MRLLIVEDEVHLAEALTHILKKKNYTVDWADNGIDGLDCSLSGIYDLIILDIMLPKMDGITVLRNIRKEGNSVPVILLTAKGEIADKIEGLDSGADDYLSKPFATDELLARIRALSRRKGEIVLDHTLNFGDIALNVSTLMLSKEDRKIKLLLKECELLEMLMMQRTAVSKEAIIEKLWGFDRDVEHNNVEVYVSFLRKKLNYLNANVEINTIRGRGYLIEVKN